MKKLLILVVLVAATLYLNSCNKDDANSSDYSYQVRMTDAPGPYQEVNIDLVGVEIINSSNSVVALDVTPGIYNLLTLSNGVEALIATSMLKDSKVSQIRLLLGTNNTVKVNNVVYPLDTPSADQSGLKLNVNQTLESDIVNTILIDFDANQSIVVTGNGTYTLKPVLRSIVTATTGNIKGSITPIGTLASVSATSTTTSVSYMSSSNALGNFQITGLAAGTYNVTITPLLPLLPYTQVGVVVQTGVSTNMGVINF